MNITDKTLRQDEKIIFSLRSLYEQNGYNRFKMSKFEEYDLYVRNKDFLISDSIITFTDIGGKLMALKPDVTLSIVKNSKDKEGFVQKVYYDENVYRVSKGTGSFKEIKQVGLECIGSIDSYCILEVLSLACESLKTISSDSLLVLSQLDIISDVINEMELNREKRKAVIKCLGEKNLHGLELICNEAGVDSKLLCSIAALDGAPSLVLPKLKLLPLSENSRSALAQLEELISSLEGCGYADMLRVDFSAVSDMNYYNGVVFKGYISGVPAQVLSGGQYDLLLNKLHRKAKALGFAVYIDDLSILDNSRTILDADIVLLYDENCNISGLRKAALSLNEKGTVAVMRSLPEDFRYGKKLYFSDGEVISRE